MEEIFDGGSLQRKTKKTAKTKNGRTQSNFKVLEVLSVVCVDDHDLQKLSCVKNRYTSHLRPCPGVTGR